MRETLWITLGVAAVGVGTAVWHLARTWPARTPAPPPARLLLPALVGNTPLVLVPSLSALTGCRIYAKLELCNPGGLAKDRVALAILQDAIARGQLVPKPNAPLAERDVVFEGTSGSTGILLAVMANALGLRAHISLPDDTSAEKVGLLALLGALLNKVRPALIVDPDQYVNAARRACADHTAAGRRGVFANQFENTVNWVAHYTGTGPEIYRQTDGRIDCFVAGSGTGGTILGVLRYLKEHGPVHVVLADPQGLGLANRVNHGVMFDHVELEGTRRRHQVDTLVEGIGLNRVTYNFHQGEHCIDEAVRVLDREALAMARHLLLADGFFWGSSAAVAAVAAMRYALQHRDLGKVVVMVACDSGERHLSKFWKEAQAVPEVEVRQTVRSLAV